MTIMSKAEVRAALIAICEDNDGRGYVFCTWCRTWKVRSTNQSIVKLTDEEFDLTRIPSNGVSHGCCSSCAKTLKKEANLALRCVHAAAERTRNAIREDIEID